MSYDDKRSAMRCIVSQCKVVKLYLTWAGNLTTCPINNLRSQLLSFTAMIFFIKHTTFNVIFTKLVFELLVVSVPSNNQFIKNSIVKIKKSI